MKRKVKRFIRKFNRRHGNWLKESYLEEILLYYSNTKYFSDSYCPNSILECAATRDKVIDSYTIEYYKKNDKGNCYEFCVFTFKNNLNKLFLNLKRIDFISYTHQLRRQHYETT